MCLGRYLGFASWLPNAPDHSAFNLWLLCHSQKRGLRPEEKSRPAVHAEPAPTSPPCPRPGNSPGQAWTKRSSPRPIAHLLLHKTVSNNPTSAGERAVPALGRRAPRPAGSPPSFPTPHLPAAGGSKQAWGQGAAPAGSTPPSARTPPPEAVILLPSLSQSPASTKG